MGVPKPKPIIYSHTAKCGGQTSYPVEQDKLQLKEGHRYCVWCRGFYPTQEFEND